MLLSNYRCSSRSFCASRVPQCLARVLLGPILSIKGGVVAKAGRRALASQQLNTEFEQWLAANPHPAHKERQAVSPTAQSTSSPEPQDAQVDNLLRTTLTQSTSTAPVPAATALPTSSRFHLSALLSIIETCLSRYPVSQFDLDRGVWHLRDPQTAAEAELHLPKLARWPPIGHNGTAEGTAWTSGQSEYDPWGHQTTISTNHLQAYAHQLSQCNSITSESETQPPSSGQANRHLSVPNTNLAVQDFAVVLLSADSAALALYQGGRMAQHKVLTGYTTRRCQGKAQATYERQGGQRRGAGAALRASETKRLWQEAGARLRSWAADLAKCERLFLSGDTRVVSLLFGDPGDLEPTVPRKDPRWMRVGLSVPRPRLRDVEAAVQQMAWGRLLEWKQEQKNEAVVTDGPVGL